MANNHSPFFALAKKKYDDGVWPVSALRLLVQAGRITAEEFEEITGQVYGA